MTFQIHLSVVSGSFYPKDPVFLREMIQQFLLQAKKYQNLPIPKALIAPHAGYVYSGSIAASAYVCLTQPNMIKKVVVVAPSHQLHFFGIATSRFDFFETPLGRIPVDQKAVSTWLSFSNLSVLENAFTHEHALEVQLPFLQSTLKTEFLLIPLIVGQVSYESLAKVLEPFMQDNETLLVISSDLSHYLDNESAKKMDRKTAKAIVNLEPDAITWEQACGRTGIQALLSLAKKYLLTPHVIDLRNSGDTQGDRERVVGYGAFHFGKITSTTKP